MCASSSPIDLQHVEEAAARIRLDIAEMYGAAGGGCYGGSLSVADIVAVLYFGGLLRLDPTSPDRDRIILSKGHSAAALFGALVESGYCPRSWMGEFESLGAHFGTHPDMTKVPGVDFSTGSLGHGLSVGVGMAIGARLSGRRFFVYVIMGDGECHEGAVWEAAMAASKYGLGNLIGIIDANGLCDDGSIDAIMPLEPLADKWTSFGWEVRSIDGHSYPQLLDAFAETRVGARAPQMIIARTTKGRGVSFMAGRREWHRGKPTAEQFAQIVRELGGTTS